MALLSLAAGALIALLATSFLACDRQPNTAGAAASRPSGPSGAIGDPLDIAKVRLRMQDPRGAAKGDYGGQVILLVRLDSGKVVVPEVWQEVPKRSGFMGRIEYEHILQPPLQASDNVIAVPRWAEISRYILLVKSLDEETGWRCFEFGKEGLSKAVNGATTVMKVPDLLTLESLDQRKDGRELWKAYKRAELERVLEQ